MKKILMILLALWMLAGCSGEPGSTDVAGDPADIYQAAEALGERYGLTIKVGTDCDREFDSFTAARITSADRVEPALEKLEAALASYPEGFFEQLRYDGMGTIEIQLVGGLLATDERAGGSYAAFTQVTSDHYLLVADVFAASENSYFHEFSHIIDAYLAWDASNREDALYSEEGWTERNPADFEYVYSYSSQPQSNGYPEYFVDTYSMVSPTEDRARVLEYAMDSDSGWMFGEYPGLKEKLRYYCECIRDAFDTTGWPEAVLWEQYL